MDLSALEIDRKRGARRSRGRKWIVRGVVVVAAVALLLVFRGPLGAAWARATAPTVRVVVLERTDPASLGALSGAAANGYVVAARRAALSADTPGRIVELNVTEGTRVAQGDVVAKLYDDEVAAAFARTEAEVAEAEVQVAAREADVARAEAELAASQADLPRLRVLARAAAAEVEAAQARLRIAELDVERNEQLVGSEVSSQRELDQALASRDEFAALVRTAEANAEAADDAFAAAEVGLEVLRAGVGQAEAAVDAGRARVAAVRAASEQAAATLDKTFVRAPFDGVVVLKDAEIGEVVSPNSQGGSNARGSVATMVDLGSLEVQAEVPETSLSAVAVGAPARVFLDAFPDDPYDGTVDRIWPTADRQKATVEVRVRFAELDDRLRPEMGVRVVFLNADDVAALAAAARGEAPPLLLPPGALVERDGAAGVFVPEDGVARFRPVGTSGERGGRSIVASGLAEGDAVIADPPEGLADGDPVALPEGA